MREIGPNFDHRAIIDATLTSAGEILEVSGVSLVVQGDAGATRLEHSWGHDEDPLLSQAAGQRLLARMIETGRPCVIDDLENALDDPAAARLLGRLRAVVAVPLEGQQQRFIVAYAPQPDGEFDREDVRFWTPSVGIWPRDCRRRDCIVSWPAIETASKRWSTAAPSSYAGPTTNCESWS